MAVLAADPARILDTFLTMVRIDSPSGQEEHFRIYLAERLQALGISYRVDGGGNLIGDVPAYQCAHDAILLISGHMDVVPPCVGINPSVEGEGNEQVVVSDGTTVLGADDKSALASIVEAVSFALENRLPRPAIRLVFTTREETFLGGAKDLEDDTLKAGFAVTFDHTGRQGTIIEQAPSYMEFRIECRGKSVHAGIMPEQGINAIVYASRVIERLHLGRIDENTTANLGFIQGGKGTNVVPDRTIIRGELRGHDPPKLDAEIAHIQQVLEEEKIRLPGAEYTLTHHLEFQGYRIDKESIGVKRVIEAVRQADLDPQFITTHGGSDNNIFIHRGLPGVVMGASFVEPHSLHERVKVMEMVRCSQLLLRMMACFAREPF